jgi:hypothetical protein
MIPPLIFILVVVGALVAVGVTLTFDAQRRSFGLLVGIIAGAAVAVVGYLLLGR